MKTHVKQIALLILTMSAHLTLFPQKVKNVNLIEDGDLAELTDNKLINQQLSIQSSYKKENYTKCIKKSSERLNKGVYDKVAYYYLGLSTFKVYEEKSNEVLFDKSLIYLSSSHMNSDHTIMNLKADDQLVLNQIHNHAIELSKRDFKKHRTKALKRLKYVAEIFQDTIDIYKDFISDRNLKNKFENEMTLNMNYSKGTGIPYEKKNENTEIKLIARVERFF